MMTANAEKDIASEFLFHEHHQHGDNWDIKVLLQKACLRVKKRFVHYIVAVVVSGLILAAFTLILLCIGLLLGYPLYQAQNWGMLTVLVGGILVIALVAFGYLTAWIGLGLTKIIMQENPKVDIARSFKSVQPFIHDFFTIQFFMGLFIFGLIPFIVLSFGVVGIIWSVYINFLLFVYLDKKKRGMDNLWLCKAMISPHLWAIAGRIFLLSMIIGIITSIFTAMDSIVLKIVGYAISLLAAPFSLSYHYEIYKNLNEPKTFKRPTDWIIASILGFGLSLVVVIALIFVFIQNGPNSFTQDSQTTSFPIPPASLDYGGVAQ